MPNDYHGRSQAVAQCESIAQMVAALECDYERLAELRQEYRDLAEEFGAEVEVWEARFGDELDELEKAAGDCESQDQARERIEEDPLSVLVRSGWCAPGEEAPEWEEFEILLCTGGPAVRIRGELGRHFEPERALVEYQDWGTPWTELVDRPIETDTLLTYCRQFYFGG